MKGIFGSLLALSTLTIAGAAAAWGNEGHEITGLIAYNHLTPAARSKVDALLTSDTDTLTAPDFASRATLGGQVPQGPPRAGSVALRRCRTGSSGPYGRLLRLSDAGARPASQPRAGARLSGHKIQEFAAELRDPTTPPPERLLALKFLIHFVGDVHQPLPAADHDDQGGNCITLASRIGPSMNLHAYWDTGVMASLDDSPVDIATRLDRAITPAEIKAWSAGDPKAWAMESFNVAKTVAYALPSLPTCAERGSVALSAGYQTAAQKIVVTQLEKAGVRIAYVLNQAFS